MLPHPQIPLKFFIFSSLGFKKPQNSSPMARFLIVDVTIGNPSTYLFRKDSYFIEESFSTAVYWCGNTQMVTIKWKARLRTMCMRCVFIHNLDMTYYVNIKQSKNIDFVITVYVPRSNAATMILSEIFKIVPYWLFLSFLWFDEHKYSIGTKRTKGQSLRYVFWDRGSYSTSF